MDNTNPFSKPVELRATHSVAGVPTVNGEVKIMNSWGIQWDGPPIEFVEEDKENK